MTIVFSFGGETATRRAKDILGARGIRADLIRLSEPGRGCRFGLRVNASQEGAAKRILDAARIAFSIVAP